MRGAAAEPMSHLRTNWESLSMAGHGREIWRVATGEEIRKSNGEASAKTGRYCMA